MATRVQIKCVNKSDRPNPHERILNIGGSSGADAPNWKRSQQQAIIDIESGTYDYFVRVGGSEVNVIVAVGRWNNKYDGGWGAS